MLCTGHGLRNKLNPASLKPLSFVACRNNRHIMEQFILALDQGTTSSRAILFDHAGAIRTVAQREFTQHYPQPGWVEHDADEIWATQAGVRAEVIAKAAGHLNQVSAIGIPKQLQT